MTHADGQYGGAADGDARSRTSQEDGCRGGVCKGPSDYLKGNTENILSSQTSALDHVNYDALDRAKMKFIEAGKKTLTFAERYGFMPDGKFGASANVFSLDLKPFLKAGAESLQVTLLPEGLGTADDARPDDLSDEELRRFWKNIGTKTVAVMTNDAASSGMQTILISLYLPSAKPELAFSDAFMDGFLEGFVEGCRTVGCVYFSGETPQLKTKLYEDKIDIAGALFGVMPPGTSPVDSSRMHAGNKIVFLASSGPHENGFTSLRELAGRLPDGYRTVMPSGKQYWEGINAGSVLYTPIIQDVLSAGILPTNIEPISGHGWQKLMRPKAAFRYVVEKMPEVPEVFQFVSEASKTPPGEMIKIFNYGVGMAVFVRTEKEADRVVEIAGKHGVAATLAGHVEASDAREVFVKPMDVTLTSESFLLEK